MPEITAPDSYYDDHVQLAVVVDVADIRVTAAAPGLGVTVALSVLGAQRLSTMLDRAVTTAVTRGRGGA